MNRLLAMEPWELTVTLAVGIAVIIGLACGGAVPLSSTSATTVPPQDLAELEARVIELEAGLLGRLHGSRVRADLAQLADAIHVFYEGRLWESSGKDIREIDRDISKAFAFDPYLTALWSKAREDPGVFRSFQQTMLARFMQLVAAAMQPPIDS